MKVGSEVFTNTNSFPACNGKWRGADLQGRPDVRKVQEKTGGADHLTLNAKLQPQDRHELEDAFNDVAENKKWNAEVVGGGTLLEENGEVKACDIDIHLQDASPSNVEKIISAFEAMLAPVGSRYILIEEAPVPFGRHQGLGLYLNGPDLPENVYCECDSNFVHSECTRLLGGIAMVNSPKDHDWRC